jgi:tetratricopeptide (TPR) repeat protein/energy-coupling factor transporter ATP-binding protein EcfA2
MSVKTSDLLSNPFPGLRPFEFNEHHLFFGREGRSEELLKKLRRNRFVAVVGTSGSGKSSLVRAGLLPLLYGGFMSKAGPHWRLAVFRPGIDPIHNMAVALNSPSVFEPSDEEMKDIFIEQAAATGQAQFSKETIKVAAIETVLRRSALGLVDYVKRARMDKGENLLVVVDQFEELFRFKDKADSLHSTDEAAAFVKLLLEAVNEDSMPIYVALTMRSDFLGDCAQFRDLPETINESQYLIPRMTRDQQRDAIVCPAAVRETKMTQRLVKRLLNDIGDDPDQLPILQHALMRTWEFWVKDAVNGADGEIDIKHYEAIGGMTAALSRHADEAYAELLDQRSKKIAEKLFKALTETVHDNREVRRPAELKEICAIAQADLSEVIPVIEKFRHPERSFLMPPQGTELTADTLIDISHESLIRGWTLLKTWVEEEAQSAQMYRRLAEDAVLHKKGKEGLMRDPGLTFALEWRDTQHPNKAWAQRYHPAFDETLSFLEDSARLREEEAEAEKKRAQDRLDRQQRELEREKDLAEARQAKAEAEKARAEEEKRSAEAERQRAEADQRFAEAERQRAEAERERAVAERERAEAAQRVAQRESEFNLAMAEEQKRLAEVEHKRADEQAWAARRLRFAVFSLIVMFLLATGAAVYAFQKQSEAKREKAKAEGQRAIADDQTMVAVLERQRADNEAQTAKQRSVELAVTLEKVEKVSREREDARRQALAAAGRASQQARLARQAQLQAQAAQQRADELRGQAETRYVAEMRAREQAELALRARERDQKNREALLSRQIGKLEDAEKKFQDVRDSYKGEEDPQGESWVYYNLGMIYRDQDKYSEAENAYKSALEKQAAASQKHGAKIGQEAENEMDRLLALPILDRLAHLYQESGRYKEAEDAYGILTGILEDSYSGDNSTFLISTKSDLADLSRTKAEDLTTTEIEQIEGEIDKLRMEELKKLTAQTQQAQAPENQALFYLSASKICASGHVKFTDACGKYERLKKTRDEYYQKATTLYDAVLSFREDKLPFYHPTLAISYSNLAQVFHGQSGKKSQADSLNSLAAQIRGLKAVSNPSKKFDLSKVEGLADTYTRAKRWMPAEAAYKYVAEAWREGGAAKNPELSKTLLKLARLYDAQGQPDAAEKQFKEILSIPKSNDYNPFWVDTLFKHTLEERIAEFYSRRGNFEEADRFYKLDLDIRRKEAAKGSSADDKYLLANGLSRLSNHAERQNRIDEAISLSREALDVNEKALGPDSVLLSDNLVELADLLSRTQNNSDDVISLFERAHELDVKLMADELSKPARRFMIRVGNSGLSVSREPTSYFDNTNRLASLYSKRNRVADAERLYKEALVTFLQLDKDLQMKLDAFWDQKRVTHEVYYAYARTLSQYAEFLTKEKRSPEAAEMRKRAQEMEKLSESSQSEETEETEETER